MALTLTLAAVCPTGEPSPSGDIRACVARLGMDFDILSVAQLPFHCSSRTAVVMTSLTSPGPDPEPYPYL